MIGALWVVLSAVEPHSRLEFQIPNELVCVDLPESSGPDSCPAIPAERLSAFTKGGVFVFANDPVRHVVLTGTRVALPGASTMSDAKLNESVAGLLSGLGSAGTYCVKPRGAHDYELVEAGGVTVALSSFEMNEAGRLKTPNRASVETIMVPSEDELITFTFTAPSPDPATQALLRSLKAPTTMRTKPEFGSSQSFRLGYLAGQALGGLFCLCAPILVLVNWLRRKRVATTAKPG